MCVCVWIAFDFMGANIVCGVARSVGGKWVDGMSRSCVQRIYGHQSEMGLVGTEYKR